MVEPVVTQLFMREKDPTTGKLKAIPKFFPGAEEMMLNPKLKVTLTLMLDGQCVKIISVPGEPQRQMYRRMRVMQGSAIVAKWFKCERSISADKALWEAFDEEKPWADGIYEVIGPDFKGNPHGIAKNRMFRVMPAGVHLCTKLADHQIYWGHANIKVQALYDQILKEMSHNIFDAEGIAFHDEVWANGVCTTAKALIIRRKDMGLEWPIKAQEEKPQAQVPVTTPVQGNLVHGPGWNLH